MTNRRPKAKSHKRTRATSTDNGSGLEILDGRIYDVWEASGALSLPVKTVQRLCREGRMAHVKTSLGYRMLGESVKDFARGLQPVTATQHASKREREEEPPI